MSITVMCLQEAKEANLEDFDASETRTKRNGLRCAYGAPRQLILPFHDLEKTVQGVRCPKPVDVAAALDFAREPGALCSLLMDVGVSPLTTSCIRTRARVLEAQEFCNVAHYAKHGWLER